MREGGRSRSPIHRRSRSPPLAEPDQPGTATTRIAALIAGGGRTLLNLLDWIERGDLDARIVTVIASRPGIAGIERARQRGCDLHVAGDGTNDEVDFDARVLDGIEASGADLVCLCGWLQLLPIGDSLVGRVMNIHPALLPLFGGQGLYGWRVHEAVLAAGSTVSGCTVHFADEQYDHGPIILQRTCPVLPDDDPPRLARRVFEQECIAYPEAIKLWTQRRVLLEDGAVHILPEEPVA